MITIDNINENKEYSVGDIIKFDSNFRGVNSKIKTGEIISVDRGIATKGYSDAGNIYKVKLDNGNIMNVDDNMIIKSTLDEQTLRLGDPWNHWTDVFKIFNLIANIYSGNKKVINDKVREFYDMFKGIKVVDTAYDKWTENGN